MTIHTINITPKLLETVGTGTIISMMPRDWIPANNQVTKVKLVFHQTSMAWRREHGGPEQYIINEFVIPVIIQDIFWIQKQGVKVEVVLEEVY